MKRTCNNCKALNTTFLPQCDLGFKIQEAKEMYGLIVSWKPLEECPKPKTYSDYIYFSHLKTQGKSV